MIRSLNGRTPKIHPTAFISEAAYVVGDVEIGENSSVWPGSVIRGGNPRSSSAGTPVSSDNSTIHSERRGAIRN